MRIKLFLNTVTMLVSVLTACAPKSLPRTTEASNTEAPMAFTKTPAPIPSPTNTFTPTIDPTPILFK